MQKKIQRNIVILGSIVTLILFREGSDFIDL